MAFDAAQSYLFTCKLREGAPITRDHVRWAVGITHQVARWNRNTEWNRKVLCVTDDNQEIMQHLTIAQRDVQVGEPTAFKNLGATWPRYLGMGNLGAAIWLKHDQGMLSMVDTLAHELAHVVTKSVHGWSWRRMNIILTPMIRAHIYHDMAQLNTGEVEEITKTTMRQYRTTRMSGYHTNSLRDQVHVEMSKHIRAAQRAFDRFEPYIKQTLPHN